MERYDNERLSDNTHFRPCKQCKGCINWGHTTAFENAYDKGSCDMYPYPEMKPDAVIWNTGRCVYRVAKDG